MKKKLFKLVAHTVLLSLGYQLVFPVCAYALTTGPSQPEVQSFEPVGTTEMVDMFSGDFNYNIPLLDVEGYPVNIFYHSGVGMEQEASWVGLGWNINPGEINRTVRGLPDDFNGETIEKYTKIKEEKDVRIGVGATVAVELLGKDALDDQLKLGLTREMYVSDNNYKGMSAGRSMGVSLSGPIGSVGINIGIGSQSGADIDVSGSLKITGALSENSGGSISYSGGTGFNSRTGLKDFVKGISYSGNKKIEDVGKFRAGFTSNTTIPIGLQNYVPVITNSFTQTATRLQVKFGYAASVLVTSPFVNVLYSKTVCDRVGDRPGYGYLYAENALKKDILDFSRDKDGIYNKTLKNLPPSTMTYDIYTVNGQGTGGMFRPFRNDIGTIYDPTTGGSSSSKSVGVEGGAGLNAFEVGGDVSVIDVQNSTGAWQKLDFSRDLMNSIYEKTFFKQAGELTYNQQQTAPQLFNQKAQYLDEDLMTLRSNYSSEQIPPSYAGYKVYWGGDTMDRSARANMISYQTAAVASIPEIALDEQITSYENGPTYAKNYDPKLVKYNRNAANKGHQISEFSQTLPDGRRYIYGIPAMNHLSHEVTFAVDESKANTKTGYVRYSSTDDSKENGQGLDNYYSTTNTPAYAHSYLLTASLSADYVDILGDGPTDDDLGSYVKFNYTLTDNDYRWRTPYSLDSAQYNPGFWSDNKDGKANYLSGSRQQWYLRSIESKNYTAQFFTSARLDGKGIQAALLKDESNMDALYKNAKGSASLSYELDSIRLYNKHDLYINGDNASPIKTVLFDYNYSLCHNTPNSDAVDKGKLTLNKIYFRYGKSAKNLLSPYVFSYDQATNNPDYNFGAKDRWGNYKPADETVYNYLFPYTAQPDNTGDVDAQNKYLSAWNLTDIKLPSGGKIHVNYESDDYAFVQNKRAMQMLQIEGVGSSVALDHRTALYTDEKNINDYVYFKRRKTRENPNLNMKDNYLEGQDLLYYNFNLDITGNGKFEYVKGYAQIESVGYCDNDPNSEYGYIKLKRDQAGNMSLHPATVYGLNTARYYLPHILYPGGSADESADVVKIWKGLFGNRKELLQIFQNPFKAFIKKQKAKNFRTAHSWIRLQTPGLTKKGGGVRVKQLILSDSWKTLAGGEDASYGRTYDYTTYDPRYGTISSGVASYEPFIGNDENPFHLPVAYAAESGRMRPAINFFQEEPFGESFFPGASVGYSSVRVKSIHAEEGRSAQALDEYLFYTAKDFPVIVDYTQKNAPPTVETHSLTYDYREEKALQGYVLCLNDMHGKPKEINNYVVNRDGTNIKTEKITGTTYNYNKGTDGRLNNNVLALLRRRGTVNNYEMKQAILGQDMDFTVDSRMRDNKTSTTRVELNLNVDMSALIPLPFFNMMLTDKDEQVVFKSMVSTKIIQQYGILKSVESYDHGARTVVENMVYDGETGQVLLTKINNQFNDQSYKLQYPAYLAYEGMRPAYTNANYQEQADSMVVNANGDGYLYTGKLSRFSPGDELLVETSYKKTKTQYKLWVTGKGPNTMPGKSIDADKVGSGPEFGSVIFWKPATLPQYEGAPPDPCVASGGTFKAISNGALITISSATAPPISVLLSTFYDLRRRPVPECGSNLGGLTFNLPEGTYNYTIGAVGISAPYTGSFTIRPAGCESIGLWGCYHKAGGCCPPTTECHCEKEYTDLIVVQSPPLPPTEPDMRCAVKVAPRSIRKFAPGTSTPNISNWPDVKVQYKNVVVKVIRSGRRNHLDKTVQQMQLTTEPLLTTSTTLLNRVLPLLSVSANTFTENAVMYDGYQNKRVAPDGTTYTGFNDYVLGLKGNFRPEASYAPLANRTYSREHSRYDGEYTMTQQFWTFTNKRFAGNCEEVSDVLFKANLAGSLFWKNAATITKYDINGNALEERDAIGNYSAAQYGYNQTLPVAVAVNANQQSFFFDGFEDYAMLLPQNTQAMWGTTPMHSPLTSWFPEIGTVKAVGPYQSENATGYSNSFSRNGQNFHMRNLTGNGGLEISAVANHTGYYSLKTTTAKALTIGTSEFTNPAVYPFLMKTGQKYLLHFWARSVAGTALTGNMFTTKIGAAGAVTNMLLKTNAIDGWYLLEAVVDLKTITSATSLTISLPANVYVDDMRMMPSLSNMKSFVYDPATFRLIAQMDENNMATFFEYDQEGLLVRTKKETTKGIVTISESRRANAKN